MNLDSFKIFFAFVGSSSASIVTYFSLDYFLDINLHLTEYSIFKNDEELEVHKNTNTEGFINFIIMKTSSENSGKWQCYLKGKYSPMQLEESNITAAQNSLEQELKDFMISGANKKNNKWGLLKSCARNRKNTDLQTLNTLVTAEIVLEIEKVGEIWKFKESDKKALLSGKIPEQKAQK